MEKKIQIALLAPSSHVSNGMNNRKNKDGPPTIQMELMEIAVHEQSNWRLCQEARRSSKLRCKNEDKGWKRSKEESDDKCGALERDI